MTDSGSGVLAKPLHSLPSHQRKVMKEMRITNNNMMKLDEFRSRFWELNDRHGQLWKEFVLYCVRSYNDPKLSDYSSEVRIKVDNLHQDWKDLRHDMERFLESKHLPTSYPERKWYRPAIGNSESFWGCYDGSYVSAGYDFGPAVWCAITLDGMTGEMHERLHLQRIELYTKLGLIAGLAGVILSIVSIAVSV